MNSKIENEIIQALEIILNRTSDEIIREQVAIIAENLAIDDFLFFE
ncbi:MAG: hypothetical protein ACXQS8_06925 [Candidatus Helarchaeales archaeon]